MLKPSRSAKPRVSKVEPMRYCWRRSNVQSARGTAIVGDMLRLDPRGFGALTPSLFLFSQCVLAALVSVACGVAEEAEPLSRRSSALESSPFEQSVPAPQGFQNMRKLKLDPEKAHYSTVVRDSKRGTITRACIQGEQRSRRWVSEVLRSHEPTLHKAVAKRRGRD